MSACNDDIERYCTCTDYTAQVFGNAGREDMEKYGKKLTLCSDVSMCFTGHTVITGCVTLFNSVFIHREHIEKYDNSWNLHVHLTMCSGVSVCFNGHSEISWV